MDVSTPDARIARHHLAERGWIARNTESFRHVPPPSAAAWLGEDGRGLELDSATEAPTGWTLQAVDDASLRAVDARWLDATDAAQRRELFAGVPTPDNDDAAPFAWAHRALCREGLRLTIGCTAGDEPPTGRVVSLQLRHRIRSAVEAPMLVVDIAAGTHCRLVEFHERAPCDDAGGIVQNLQAHVLLRAGATLQHLRVVLPAQGDNVAHNVHARLDRGARYQQALVAAGSGYHLQRTAIELTAEHSTAHLGSVLTAAGTALDRQVRVTHGAAHTASTVEGLALAGGKARAVLNAHTSIAPGADGAKATQRLAGIPTAGQPRVVLRPHLEILHDNVQAAHGATWGALPEDAMFYARQRGLDEQHARALIVEGMAATVLERGLDDSGLMQTLGIDDLLSRVVARHLADCAEQDHD